jgi:hypothetical protein
LVLACEGCDKKGILFPLGGGIAVRAFLTLLIGAILLEGCAAKQTTGSAQAVSAQEDKDRAACLEQPPKKETYDEHQKSFASCMRVKGYNEDKLYPSETTANAGKPSISDGMKSMARESSSSLAASEDYESAIADDNNCVLDHTSNLSACEKQRAIMNGLGKVLSRSSLGQSYETTPRTTQTTNTAGVTQGANTANTTQATSRQMPGRLPPTPQETVIADPEPLDTRSVPPDSPGPR